MLSWDNKQLPGTIKIARDHCSPQLLRHRLGAGCRALRGWGPTHTAISLRPAPRDAADAWDRSPFRTCSRSDWASPHMRPIRALRRFRMACRPAATAARAELSRGKDTAERPLGDDGPAGRNRLGLFPDRTHLPLAALTTALIERAKLPRHHRRLPCLGHRDHRAAGARAHRDRQTDLLHLAPIPYSRSPRTKAFGLERLYEVCHIARELVDAYEYRAGHRAAFPWRASRRYSSAPQTATTTPRRRPELTLLDVAKARGREVIGIGKIGEFSRARA